MIENVYIEFKTKIRDNQTILQKNKYTSSIESNNSNYISKNPITKLIGLYSNSIKIITKWICIYLPKRGVKEVHKKCFEPCKKD